MPHALIVTQPTASKNWGGCTDQKRSSKFQVVMVIWCW